MGIIALTLSPLNGFTQWSIGRHFSSPELVVMLLAGPMFLTRAGNLIAIATMIYGATTMLIEPAIQPPSAGLLILFTSLTITAILADRMPWHPRMNFGSLAQQIRNFFFVAICSVSLAFTIIAIIRVKPFGIWIDHLFFYQIPARTLFFALTALLLGWFGVLLGYTRHALLPVLCLPTYLVVTYLTNLPNHVLIVPFAATVALSLASADHFYNFQRRARR
jgi:hypothetical protein